MAKIAQVSSKYIIHSTISIEGVVDRPDVIGAIFGQTEGLLGEDLELRELQKSGRIGRIEVNTEIKTGRTNGEIIIPSSLDKAETAIIAAALEVIQRIGPCNAKLQVTNIEDIRISKRKFVIERAKELLKELIDGVMPDSQELADEVAYSVRVTEIKDYGKERLAAGPMIEDSDEIIVVEGRADVLNLLKYGFKNAIAVGGTGVPKTIVDLCRQKTVTVFVDGDRGGDLIVKELMSITEIDYITKAPDGKEVEELTKKEIHKALRAKIASEQAHLDTNNPFNTNTHATNNNYASQNNNNYAAQKRYTNTSVPDRRSTSQSSDKRTQSTPDRRSQNGAQNSPRSTPRGGLRDEEKQAFNSMLEDLIGTRGAYILDTSLSILGKIPISELESTVKSLNNAIHAIVFDGDITKEILAVSERSNVRYLVGMNAKVKPTGKTQVLTPDLLA